jgi:AcrR family transcriptional regulator
MAKKLEISEASKPNTKERKKRGQSPKLLRKREKILAKSGQLFWKKSYLGTSISDIARAAGLNKSAVFYYFDNKVSILYTIATESLKELIEQAKSILNSDQPAPKKLELLITTHFGWQTTNVGAAIGQLERRNLTPKLLRDMDALRNQYEDIFIKIIKEIMVQRNCQISEAQNKIITRFVLGFANSLIQWYKPSGRLSAEEIAAQASSFIFKGLDSFTNGSECK